MRRSLLLMSLVTSALSVPALATAPDDAVMLAADADLGAALAGIGDGSVRLVYLDSAPPAAVTLPAPPVAAKDRPPRAPIIVVANSCGWSEPDASLMALRASLPGPVWLLSPEAPDCAPDAIAATARKAAATASRDRLAMLLAGGLKLSTLERPDPASANPAAPGEGTGASAPAAPVRTAALGGKLVISALPAGAAIGGAPAVVIRASTGPVASATAVAATSAPVAASGPATAGPSVTIGVSPRRPGQPDPAIIVGELAGLLGARTRGPHGVPRDIRDRIREIDPAFFEMLLNDGRFDPSGGDFAGAIQTELQQMSCYTGTVDGQWGGGSLAALQRYFSTLGQAQAGTTPGPELFRRIATNARVVCPVPVAAPPRATPTPTPARATRDSVPRSTRDRPAVSRQPQPVAQPAPAQPAVPASRPGGAPQIDPNRVGGLGSGVPR